jgi:hypothetical protein
MRLITRGADPEIAPIAEQRGGAGLVAQFAASRRNSAPVNSTLSPGSPSSERMRVAASCTLASSEPQKKNTEQSRATFVA